MHDRGCEVGLLNFDSADSLNDHESRTLPTRAVVAHRTADNVDNEESSCPMWDTVICEESPQLYMYICASNAEVSPTSPCHARNGRRKIISPAKSWQNFELFQPQTVRCSTMPSTQQTLPLQTPHQMADSSAALTTKVGSGTPYKLDPNQVVRAAEALVKHIKAQTQRTESQAAKKSLLATDGSSSDDEAESEGDVPVWLILTTKKVWGPAPVSRCSQGH